MALNVCGRHQHPDLTVTRLNLVCVPHTDSCDARTVPEGSLLLLHTTPSSHPLLNHVPPTSQLTRHGKRCSSGNTTRTCRDTEDSCISLHACHHSTSPQRASFFFFVCSRRRQLHSSVRSTAHSPRAPLGKTHTPFRDSCSVAPHNSQMRQTNHAGRHKQQPQASNSLPGSSSP